MAKQTGSFDFNSVKSASQKATSFIFKTTGKDAWVCDENRGPQMSGTDAGEPYGPTAEYPTTGWRIGEVFEMVRIGVSWFKLWVESGVAKMRLGRDDMPHIQFSSGDISFKGFAQNRFNISNSGLDLLNGSYLNEWLIDGIEFSVEANSISEPKLSFKRIGGGMHMPYTMLESGIDEHDNPYITTEGALNAGGASFSQALQISSGGTGAKTADAAWTNLGGGSIGKKNSLSTSDVTGLEDSGWQTSGTIKYRKHHGVVYVEGISNNSLTINTGGVLAATLPSGYRPSTPIAGALSTTTSNPGQFYIGTDGTITLWNLVTSNAYWRFSTSFPV